MQRWLVPSPDADIAAHAVLFRPAGDGPFRLAVIAHASTQNALRRAQMPQPEYRALAAWLVARGFAVLVPERPGHGATGGKLSRGPGWLRRSRLFSAGRAMRRPDHVGAAIICADNRSSGKTALSSSGTRPAAGVRWRWPGRTRTSISAIIAFAPGRGGHANDFPNQVCAPHTLMSSAAEFGHGARVPVSWLVAANDTYFPPDLSRQLADAFRARRRQSRFSRAAGVRRRGPLAGGDRSRGKDRRTGTGARAAAAPVRNRTKSDDAVFPRQISARAWRDGHSRHRNRHRLLHADGASQPRSRLHRAHGGDRRDRRHAVHADGRAAAARHRRIADGAVWHRACRALACYFARALCGRRAVLDSRDLHADRNARSGANGGDAAASRCRRAILCCFAAGLGSAFPVLVRS